MFSPFRARLRGRLPIDGSCWPKVSPAEKAAIEGRRPASHLSAFDQYSRTKTLLPHQRRIWTYRLIKTLLRAIELLNGAVNRDPILPRCLLSQLVFAHDTLCSVSGAIHTPPPFGGEAKLLYTGQTELRPDALDLHLARGSHLCAKFRDYRGALSQRWMGRVPGFRTDPRIPELMGSVLPSPGQVRKQDQPLWNRRWRLTHRNPCTLSQLRRLAYMSFAVTPKKSKQPPARVGDPHLTTSAAASSFGFVDVLWRADTRPLSPVPLSAFRAEHPHQWLTQQITGSYALCGAGLAGCRAGTAQRPWAVTRFWTDNPIILVNTLARGLLARAMRRQLARGKHFTAARQEARAVRVRQQKEYVDHTALCSESRSDRCCPRR